MKVICILLLGGYDWSWGGCSDNVKVGEKVVKKLLDIFVIKCDGVVVMYFYNNMVGRKVCRLVILI